jgi:nucleoside-diphosphate-sugar epimerase
LSGGIRTDLAQYRELAAFAQFASDLDEATRKQLERGRRVTELCKQAQYKPLQVWGDHSDTRDFLYSEIAATRIIQALNNRFDGMLNIGSGTERKILDVANKIREVVGVDKIEQKHGGINAIHHRNLDISVLENKFGVIADDFEQNLIKTIEWYQQNLPLARK